ncbi:hypothetical protein [Chachezhania antarctica]|uniref:hypothetical protein n=1 Tax=Chachezhania antarctica TaxID=2340860 RepID=UPI000EAD7B6C|nr:hypothetical protein [Chachezhania antarctica]|tara:strand:- start:348 stop:941 length:594 start_codon:yes stop_codon:yes gene_type:complete
MAFRIIPLLTAAIVALGLAACTEGAGLSLGASQAETQLAGGALTLVAPAGYCIDRNSVENGAEQSFALIARCPGNAGAGKPPALITVTTAPMAEGQSVPGASALARASGRGAVARPGREGLSLVQIREGETDIAGASPTRWRGVFAAGGQLVGLTLYAAPDSAALGDGGAALLSQIARLSRATSAPPTAPADDEDAA